MTAQNGRKVFISTLQDAKYQLYKTVSFKEMALDIATVS